MVNGTHFLHIVWGISLRAKKALLPNGEVREIKYFQRTFRQLVPKIRVAEELLSRYGLMPRVKLGKHNLLEIEQIAKYLYVNSIHPVLFASALHLLATKAKDIEPRIQTIQLRNLRREQIEAQTQKGLIKEDELRPFIYQQVESTTEEKLAALEKLGVIVYKLVVPEEPATKPVVEPPIVHPEIKMMSPDDPKLAGLPLFNPKRR